MPEYRRRGHDTCRAAKWDGRDLGPILDLLSTGQWCSVDKDGGLAVVCLGGK